MQAAIKALHTVPQTASPLFIAHHPPDGVPRPSDNHPTCQIPTCASGIAAPILIFYLKKVSRLVAAGLARLSMSEAAKVITTSAAVVRVIEELRPMEVVR